MRHSSPCDSSADRDFGDTDGHYQRAVEGERIVGFSEDADITLVGAPGAGLFQQDFFGAIPEQVGQRAQSPVIVAKRYFGIISRFPRWFRRKG